jgi:ligand-binding SRPBCC domain-containing protein
VRLYELTAEQQVGRPPDRVFPFFAQPENLALLTPDSLDFKLLTPSPGPMEQGRILDYTIRLLGICVRWRTVISDYDPPHGFVDEQLGGPYSFWHHTHTFVRRADGTLIRDHVLYALPACMPTMFVQALNGAYVGRALESIFRYRQHVTTRLFGGQGWVSLGGQMPLDAPRPAEVL